MKKLQITRWLPYIGIIMILVLSISLSLTAAEKGAAIQMNAGTDLAEVYVFPLPFKANEGSGNITFMQLPASCTIKIYTMMGELIATLIENDGDGQHAWDVRSDSGNPVFSGIYTYCIQSKDASKTGKLMIIR